MGRLGHLGCGVVADLPGSKPFERPLVIGHRGAAGHATENTRTAFLKGLALGADGLECDIRATLDGHLVIFHDESLLRLAGLPERLNRLTLADIRKRVKVGEAEEHVLTLEELCAMPETQDAWLFIELKEPRLEAAAVEILQKYRDPRQTVLGSFRLDTVRQLSTDGYPLPLLLAENFGAFSSPARISHAGLQFAAVDPVRVAELHRRNVKVWSWTVNETDDIQRMIASRVDGIITDYPDRVIRELDRFIQS